MHRCGHPIERKSLPNRESEITKFAESEIEL